ncbi:MAG: CDGSH iron-sulfur domain-containing protein [Actinomycetales bacterium]|nr:CDGSH iron-sulfur domain-containing protein [Actinomycetales bacterium]
MSEMTSNAATVTVLADGPLQVEGRIRILAADGTLIKECEQVFLCRCGQSGNKPFCDGTHRKVGFSGD